MKYFISIIISLLFCTKVFSQDTIFFRSKRIDVASVKEINPETIKYTLFSDQNKFYSASRDSVFKIKYVDGNIEFFELMAKLLNKQEPQSILIEKPINYDSLPIIKNAFRYYFTDIFFNKLSFGYERMINKKYSLDIDGFCKFHFRTGGNGNNWKNVLYYESVGFEIKIGASRHFYFKEKRLSAGLSIAYRQQKLENITIYSSTYDKIPEQGEYNIFQTKKGVGGFFKFNFQFTRQKSGFEFFVIPGIYGVITKNQYHSYRSQDRYAPLYTVDPAETPKFTTSYMKDGFTFLPYLNFGFDYIVKQPRKGWYKRLVHERDSLKFQRKNIVLYNPIELLDGAIGFSYVRIFYRPALSLFASYAYSAPNNYSSFSNGVLTERSRNYSVNHKNIDASLQINYNFVVRQQSFPFIGFSGRLAQFEGAYHQDQFTLNKYYLYANAGFVARTKWGLSFLLNVALGHYYNDYLSNNPAAAMERNYVTQMPEDTFNSANFSIQVGYSF